MGIAVLAALLGAGCSTNLLQGIDERNANETVAALQRAGVSAEKRPDDSAGGAGSAAAFSVRVATADEGRALELLRAQGLPRDRRRGFAEVYGQGSLIPTASEERARYLDALAGEVARTLEIADGVVSARVHLVLEETDPLAVDNKPRAGARAAVLIKARPGRLALPEADVKKLVAGSVPGLAAADVAVVITPTADAAESSAPMAAVGPLRVAPGSRPLLVGALAVGLVLLAGLASLLLFTLRRLTSLERESAAPRA
jgi:type III secretion protein J